VERLSRASSRPWSASALGSARHADRPPGGEGVRDGRRRRVVLDDAWRARRRERRRKSTLLHVIAGEESPDAERISLLARTRFAFLPQRGEVDGETPILQLIQKRISDLYALEAAMRELEQRMKGSDAAELERVMEEMRSFRCSSSSAALRAPSTGSRW
jgi:hypothetical protein